MHLMCINSLLLLLVGCSFEKDEYIIDEDRGLLQVKLKLDKSIVNEFTLQVYNEDDTAIGELCMLAVSTYYITYQNIIYCGAILS